MFVLSKFSEQILLQPFADHLVMSAFTASKSAYGKITLLSNFFARIEAPADTQYPDGDIQCRISTRTTLHIFKNVVAKGLHMPSVDSCQMELDPQSDYAIVHLQQQHAQIKRAYLIPMKEHSIILHNLFTDKQRLMNKLTTQSQMLSKLFAGLDCNEVS